MNKLHPFFAAALVAAPLCGFADETATSAIVVSEPVVATEAAPDVISAEAVAEMNKALTTNEPLKAGEQVEKNIEEFCAEAGITLGEVTPSGAIYLKGIQAVGVNAKHPNFIKARAFAYEKAYQKALALYVMDKFGRQLADEESTYFSDDSSNRLASDAPDVKTTAERIVEKTLQLDEAKLDEALRKAGVVPSGSVAKKRTLFKDAIVRKSMKVASGSGAGVLPVETSEGWGEDGQYYVGVVVRGGTETEMIADCLSRKMRPVMSRPEAGLDVKEAVVPDNELVSQFGVRFFFDKNGTPALLSYGQWGSSYTGTNAAQADRALEHAMTQAETIANEQMTFFINSTITLKEQSERSEDTTLDALFDENNVPKEVEVSEYIDRIAKSASRRGSDTMIGRSTVKRKVVTHPETGHKVAVCVRMWSFGQYEAMKRIIEKPRPQQPAAVAPTATPQGTSGRRRGRSYDF